MITAQLMDKWIFIIVGFGMLLLLALVLGQALRSFFKAEHKVANALSTSRTSVVCHLRDLRGSIIERLRIVEAAQNRSASYFAIATQEANTARVIDRKDRFSSYSEQLLDANIKLIQITSALKEDDMALSKALAVLDSNKLSSSIGGDALTTIENVIKRMDGEAIDDLLYELRDKTRKAEFVHVTKFRDAMRAAEERLRIQTKNPQEIRLAKKIDEE